MRDVADAMVAKGLVAAGYNYLNIECGPEAASVSE
eukprot:SAG31_NODE_680_length_12881_cov_35.655453_5_plen_35_part_00